MIANLKRLFRIWRNFQAFFNLPRVEKQIVIYSEGAGYASYFNPILAALPEYFAQPVIYVTSSEEDPLYRNPPMGVRCFYIGDGILRTAFFSTLDADILVMTMPDLETFHIKRSAKNVHYAYIHHAMVSTHMVYREAAFDHFDTIFCTGPHHIDETRKREALAALPPKRLVEAGYGRLDTILAKATADGRSMPHSQPTILIAPSWGAEGLIETHGLQIVETLLNSGMRVILRPHPRTRQYAKASVALILERFRDETDFLFDEEMDAITSLLEADLMISDWSGAALEFAFGLARPVVFVDGKRKVNNPNYEKLEIEPLEVFIRGEIGVLVPETNLDRLPEIVREALADKQLSPEILKKLSKKWVFNLGSSGDVVAQALVEILKHQQAE